MKPKIIVIVGPTASGKTALSIEVARKYNGEIISADSRQVYRGLTIGTEKITPDEMNGIPHHLIDIRDPDEVYSVSEFKRDAQEAIDDVVARGKLPIIAGGTGFYIDAILYDEEMPEVPPNLELRSRLEDLDAHSLFEQLIRKDPRRATTIDPHNKRRLIRALEIVETLGSVPQTTRKEAQYDALILGIKIGDEVLTERINHRLSETMKKGLIDEVKSLRESGLTWERLYELGLEYRIVSDYLQHQIPQEDVTPKMSTALRQYAKRQMTWFKRNPDILWMNTDDKAPIYDAINRFLKD